MQKVELKINKPLKNYPAGTVIRIQATKTGLPVDAYWRRRLKDAEIDGCCEFVKHEKPDKKEKQKINKKDIKNYETKNI